MSANDEQVVDAAKALFCPGRFFVFSEVSENLERQLAEANEKIQGLQDGIDYATAALMSEKALADRLADGLQAIAKWAKSGPTIPRDMAIGYLTAWKEARKQNDQCNSTGSKRNDHE